MPSFGYTTIVSGSAAFSNTHVGTLYENDSGGDVYVDQIELQNVSVARTATFQCAIYTDQEGFPGGLLGVSDILSAIGLGATTFPFTNPVGISAGQHVWLFIRTDSTLNVSNTVDPSGITSGRGPGFGYGGGSGFPSQFQLGYGPSGYSLPLVASGSSTSPGGDSDMQVPLLFSEPVAEGAPDTEVNLLLSEPLAEGTPNIQVNLVMSDGLSEGSPNVDVCLLISESLHPVAPELPMSTIPLPGFGNSTINPTIPAAADPASSALPGLSFSVHKIPVFSTNKKESVSGTEVRNSYSQYPRWRFELEYEFLEDRTGAESSLKTILGFFLQRGGSFDTWLFKDPDDYIANISTCGITDGVTTQFPLCRDLGGFLEKVGQVDMDNSIDLFLSVEENGTIPAIPGPYTITVANAADFAADIGVIKGGVPMTRVDSSPAAGQYSVAAGVYTFNSVDHDDAVVISYRYIIDPADYTITLPNLVVFDSAPPEGTLSGTFQFFFACRFEEDELDFEKFADKLWNLQECSFRSVLQ